ncbi:unnamed protein product [Cuscuta epithymum]|uniref:Tryptophan/tyrosine permease n=1 Tax=Cuscuta epithymum TaxID=186058 RepID=A0AAV0E286_9ASTE|nr:unnamed protein product [Cuscuta epithymum]
MMINLPFLSSSVTFLDRPKPALQNHSNAANSFRKFTCNWNFMGENSSVLPTLVSSGGRGRFDAAFKSFPGKPSSGQQALEVEQVEHEVRRLFSNLNQSTLKREPGSLTSAIFLVAGTSIGAGILAIPAVTQESGFIGSAVTCIICWFYMVVTGLLIAEVNVKTMSQLGSSGVSLVSMAMRTLGNTGVQIASWSYIFIHYALLVAYVARSSDLLTSFLDIPLC